MKNVQIVVKRLVYEDKQTLGEMEVFSDGEVVFTCKTLELPWKDNKTSVSCIPSAEYYVKKRSSAKYKNHLHVLDVPDRSYILVHNGNYHSQIRGCLLVGKTLADINGDGYRDVTSSKSTLNKLLSFFDGEDDELYKMTILA